ncbi:unnamed protein product [Blepharisma stoltei]|uniref:Uncharacterized protein n=1 Tax=Blepharisma stoltei TaxID=1481888 RepID=A0AAU9JI34_9CILI|nr:unnamed protein product [Blepharisma stoltei]
MADISFTSYLNRNIEELNVKIKTASFITSSLDFSTSKIIQKIRQRKLIIAEQQDVTSIINKHSSKIDSQVEKMNKSRLEHAKIQKELLTRRLEDLDSSIKMLETSNDSNISPKKTQQKYELDEDSERKIKDFKALAKRLQREKEMRRLMKEKDQSYYHLKLIAEAEEARRIEIENEEMWKINKQKQIEELKEKARIRKEELEHQKQIFREKSPDFSKPFYIVMEEKYKNEIEMPELEKRKIELAKKRQQVQPISLEEILDHAKKYKEITKEAQLRREREKHKWGMDNSIQSFTTPSRTQTYYDSESKEEELKRDHDERLKKREKQKRYGEIVRELFYPTIDEKKRFEIQKIKDRLNLPKILKPIKESTYEKLNRSTDAIQGIEKKPKKVKKERNISEHVSKTPDVKSKTIVVDYLAERRAEKSHLEHDLHRLFTKQEVHWNDDFSDIPFAEKAKLIKEKSKSIEKTARMHEILAKSTSPTHPEALKIEEHINEMLLQAVRAKLNLISSA